ncbi:MAG: hypothetical protein K2N07_04150 [Desulfovibrio sp.]|nr:hypothetical protein [Desulfovibrio sp.]
MRKLGVILALLLFTLSMDAPARAASGVLLTGEDAKEIEAILPWFITNTQGEDRNGKTAYISGGMRCPATWNTINKSPEIAENVQIKWLFPTSDRYTVRGGSFIMTEPLPEAFSQLAKGVRKEDTAFQKSAADMNALLDFVVGKKIGVYAFPTLIYNTTKGVRITPSPDDLLQEKDDIIPFTFTERDPQELRDMLEKISQTNLGNNPRYENRSQKVLHSYVLPDEASPSLDSLGYALQPDYWRPCADYNADFFICVTPEKFKFFLKKNK